MKEMLGRHLGATLVESVPAGWLDDPDVENMKTTFDIAIAQITPVLFPQLLYGLSAAGDPDFAAFAARIEPTEFAPGVMKGSGTMQPVDWMLRWAEGLEPAPLNLNLRSVVSAAGGEPRTFRFHMSQYLLQPGKGLGRSRLHRNARYGVGSERPVEVLGRRSAGGVQELGGRWRFAEPVRRIAEHRRDDSATRAVESRDHEGDARASS
jgi:hypothetical protein